MVTTWGDWAQTAKTMDEAWTGRLVARELFAVPLLLTGRPHAVNAVSVGFLGCGAGIALFAYGDETQGADAGWPQEAKDEHAAYMAWLGSLPPPPPPPPPPAYGSWWLFRFFVTAPGAMAQRFVCIGTGTYPGAGRILTYGASAFECAYRAGVENVVLKVRGGLSNPPSRQVRDFIDQHVEYGWFVTGDTVSHVTLVTPKGEITASGQWGEMPGPGQLSGQWRTTLQASYSASLGPNTELGTDYCQIAPEWEGVALNLEALDDRHYDGAWHHWWDGEQFRSPWPPEGKVARFRAYGDAGAIRLRRTGGEGLETVSWAGTSAVPYVLGLHITGGRWDEAGGDWSEPIVFDAAGLRELNGTRIYPGLGATEQYTEAAHSWYEEWRFDHVVTCDIGAEWAQANGEDVGSSSRVGEVEYALNDLPCPIAVWDLTEEDYERSPWRTAAGLLDIEQVAVNVHAPEGVQRPTQWVGSGGLTVVSQTDTTVTFTVAAGAQDPRLTRTLTTRYWTQLERLASRNPDTGLAFKPDWPIYLRANIAADEGGQMPVGDPLFEALTAAEDVTNWDNFSYLRLSYSAPRETSLRLRLTYRELEAVEDPCYTCHEHRYGAQGEFAFSTGPEQTATYEVDWEGEPLGGAGAQTRHVDLRCPLEGELRRGALQHVTQIELSGFAPPESGSETWTLDGAGLELRDGPVSGNGHGEGHLCLDVKRSWDWAGNFTGLAGLHDGAPILAIQYGYEGCEGVERGLKYQQLRRHCPESSAQSDLTSAKSLARLAQELSWQEGFTASFSQGAYDGRFRDPEGKVLFPSGSAYWWWLRYAPDGAVPLEVAATVRSVGLAPGVKYRLSVRHFLQGRAHGLLKTADGRRRLRESAAVVAVYRRPQTGGEGELVGEYGSDLHGRWRSAPLAEKGYTYSFEVKGREGRVQLGRAVNREYLCQEALVATAPEPELVETHQGRLLLFWSEQGSIYMRRREGLMAPWGERRFVTRGSSPAAGYSPGGMLWLAYERDGEVRVLRSGDDGGTWEGVG